MALDATIIRTFLLKIQFVTVQLELFPTRIQF